MQRNAVHGLVSVLMCSALVALVSGCGGGPFKMAPVSGKVCYADGSLIPGDQIVVRFHPEQAQTAGAKIAPFANGDVNVADGTFSLTSREPGDGAVPGKYKVTVVATKLVDGVPQPSAAVPEKYMSEATTPLRFEVTGPTKEANFTGIEKPTKK